MIKYENYKFSLDFEIIFRKKNSKFRIMNIILVGNYFI